MGPWTRLGKGADSKERPNLGVHRVSMICPSSDAIMILRLILSKDVNSDVPSDQNPLMR